MTNILEGAIIPPKWGSFQKSYINKFDPVKGAMEMVDNAVDSIKMSNSKERAVTINYYPETYKLCIEDTGTGFGDNENIIKKCFNMNNSIKANNPNTVGTHNVGMIASLFLMSKKDFLKDETSASLEITSVTNGHKFNITLDISRENEKTPKYKIEYLGRTNKKNGSKVTVMGVIFSDSINKRSKDGFTYKDFIEAIAMRYYKDISSGNITIYNGDEKIEGVDRMHKAEMLEKGLEVVDDEITFIKSYAINNGKYAFFEKEFSNEYMKVIVSACPVDLVNSKNANTKKTGVGIELNNVLILQGGKESWTQAGCNGHSTVNKMRVGVEIYGAPDLKEKITNHVKSEVPNNLFGITDERYAPVISEVCKCIQTIRSKWQPLSKTMEKERKAKRKETESINELCRDLINGIISNPKVSNFILGVDDDELISKFLPFLRNYKEDFSSINVSVGSVAPSLNKPKEKKRAVKTAIKKNKSIDNNNYMF